jgi:hypothetical protein
MNSFQFVANHILAIYIMIIIGVCAGKAKFLNNQISISLSKILLNICLPLYIISAFNYQFTREILLNLLIVFIFGLIVHPLCYFLGMLLYRNKEVVEKNIFTFALIFSNCGYIGFPIIESIYGNIGIIYGSIFLAPYNIYLWTIGVSLFNKQTRNVFSFINPGVIAVVIGLTLYIFQIQLPYFLEKSVLTVGVMTTPLSMLIVGGILSHMKIKEIFKSKSIYLLSLFRLIIIPLIVLVCLILLKINQIIIGVCVFVVAMPIAITLPVLTQRYNSDTVLATKTVIISTMLSILTIPIIVMCLKQTYII